MAPLADVDEGARLSEPAPPTREGYVFGGWYREAGCVNAWIFASDAIYANTTLYARWTDASEGGGPYSPTYSVSYNSMGGSAVPTETGISSGSAASEPQNPIRALYSFDGWYREPGCVNIWSFSVDVVTSNVTLYAKWEVAVYTVALDYQGGSPGATSVDVARGQDPYSMPAPSRSPYEFGGWWSAVGGSGTQYTGPDGIGLAPWSGGSSQTVTAYAYWVGTQGLAYEDIGGGKAVVSKGSVTSGSVIIPEYHDGLKVTEIGSFYSDIVSIEVPGTVEVIRAQTFNGCRSLATATFDQEGSLRVIGGGAFYGCVSLDGTIAIPSSVEMIGQNAFAYCEGIDALVFGADSRLTVIDLGAFRECNGIAGTLTIPRSVESIGYEAFQNCWGIEELIFESGSRLETIGYSAFMALSSLATHVDLPQGLKAIGIRPDGSLYGYTFWGCLLLPSIYVPSSVTSMGSGVFDYCDTLVITVGLPYPGDGMVPEGWSPSWNPDGRPVTWSP
jgi:uncharacterized repeat protein (TIGR02543 family)